MIWDMYNSTYTQTCLERWPSEQRNSGLLRQVTF